MKRPASTIVAVTVSDDIHALAISREFDRRGWANFDLIDCDLISSASAVDLRLSSGGFYGAIKTRRGVSIDLSEISTLWWRRIRANQKVASDELTEQHVSLINNDCRGALSGALQAFFKGRWISSIAATDAASDKIYQLSIAARVGFRVPETLVTQNFDRVVEFHDQFDGRVIVKPVVGVAGPLLFTQFMPKPTEEMRESIDSCPATYQEYIDGTRHIRLNCFGNTSYAAIIDSADLDWRGNLNVPIEIWEVPPQLHRMVRSTLDRLELEMGVLDLKITSHDEIVWLEVNPQGQFLFLEGITGMPLASYFVDFLAASASFNEVKIRSALPASHMPIS